MTWKIGLKQANQLFKLLTGDYNSILYVAEKITNSSLKKAEKLVYSKDKALVKMYNNSNKVSINDADIVATYTPFTEQKKYWSLWIIYYSIFFWLITCWYC